MRHPDGSKCDLTSIAHEDQRPLANRERRLALDAHAQIANLAAHRFDDDLSRFVRVASKAALESLVRHLAVEFAPDGVRVNAVSAGVVDTDALRHFPNRDEILSRSARRTPAGRLTEPDDVADAVLFLVSPLASMIVGETLVVDGGYSICA